MNRVLLAIVHFVKHAAVFVSDSFVSVFGKDAAHTLAVAVESLVHSELGAFAYMVVQEVQNLASGAEKRAAAFTKIETFAKERGIIVGESIINMLIELFVQKVKGELGPA